MRPHQVLEALARQTWRYIGRLSRNRIHFGEDAITSLNLDVLSWASPSAFAVEDTRATESTKGCDFELWVGSDSKKWRRYAVQAKKLGFKSGRYESLGHAVGGRAQIDILEDYARRNRAIPVYCFYNHSSESVPWRCYPPAEPEQLGCSITPSSVVRMALSKRGYRSYRKIHENQATVPWRCLIQCPSICPSAATPQKAWMASSNAEYLKLPANIRALRDRNAQIAQYLPPTEEDGADLVLRPGWIVVLETEEPENDS